MAGEHKVTFTVSLQDMISKGLLTSKQAADALNTSLGKVKTAAKGVESSVSSFSSFKEVGGMFAGFTLGGLAVQGLTTAWSALTSEIKESEKASIEYEKSQTLLKFAFKDSGSAANENIAVMNNLADSFKTVTPTVVIESETKLRRIADLTTEQISGLIPLIVDFAKVSGQDVGDATMIMASGIETGMIRSKELKAVVEKLGDDFKKETPIQRYGTLIKALGQYAGGAAAEMETMGGAIDVIDTKKAKIQELRGSSFFSQLGSNISLGWTELWNLEATKKVQFSEYLNNKLNSVKNSTSDVTAAWQLYNSEYAKFAAEEKVVNSSYSNMIATSGTMEQYSEQIEKLRLNYEKLKNTKDAAFTLPASFKSTMSTMTLGIQEMTGAVSDLTAKLGTWDQATKDLTDSEATLADDIYKHYKDNTFIINPADITAVQTGAATKKYVDEQLQYYETGKEPESSTPKTTAVHGNAPTTINITIGDVVKEFNINATSITESTANIKSLVAQALIAAVNDANLIPTK